MIRVQLFLILFGLGLALAGARAPHLLDPAVEPVLWVNDTPITRDYLAFAKQRLVGNESSPLSDAQRSALIELLLDEELLLQRAEELGVLREDPGIRKAIVHAAIKKVNDDFLDLTADEQTLRQFYSRHKAVFTVPASLAVTALRFQSQEAAEEARKTLDKGGTWAEIVALDESESPGHLPASLLPAHVLRRSLGPHLTSVALAMSAGEVSSPVESTGAHYLLRVDAMRAATVRDFEELVPIVRNEYLARGRELALINKLQVLWKSADIQVNCERMQEIAIGIVACPHPGWGAYNGVNRSESQW